MEKSNVSLEAIARRMVEATRAFVDRAESALNARVANLEARVSAIPAGSRGERGDAGIAGVPGERGAEGAPGLQGAAGDRGADGQLGEPGPAGESIKGDKGDLGESIVGPKGEPGESILGEKGERGESGLPGESIRGEIGPQGPQGAAGELGETGAVGPAGESIRGETGPPGKDGASIHPDTVALMVRDAVDKAVAALTPAKDGLPGKDAAELIVLPGIDETRSYPAGTYAKHNGGEIRAERRTDQVKDGDVLAAGWTVSREGIAGVVITQSDADPREIQVAAMLTGGTKAVAAFSIPMVLDRGVWRDGEFQQGDHVSWDGSGWIAQRATTDKPGTSDAFRLSTKRGRDGKDGKDGSGGSSPPAAPVVRTK